MAPQIAVFNGLNRPGISATVNAGAETPPDSTGAIGPNNYVEIVNSEIAVWRRSDLTSVSSASLNAFIGDTSGSPYCDVQVQWDPNANRWLFSFLFCDTNASTQYFVFGWSRTSDPTNLSAVNTNPAGGWCAFGLITPGMLDFDKLGHNSKYLIVGGNIYATPSSNPPFLTAAIYWIPKPASGDASCALPASFGHTTASPLKTNDGATNAFTPVPVNTMSAATDAYVVSAYDPSGSNGQVAVTPRNKLAIWHLDSSGVLHQDSDMTVANFAVPSPAPQNGSSNLLDTLDARLTQAVGDPTTGIWFQHTVDRPGGRSVVHWYEIKVLGSVASMTQQGDIASATDWVFNGAISPRFDALGAAVFYNRSSPTILPVIAAECTACLTPLQVPWSRASWCWPPVPLPTRTSAAGSSAHPVAGATTRGPAQIRCKVGLVWGHQRIHPNRVGPCLTRPGRMKTSPFLYPGVIPQARARPPPTPTRDPASQASPAPTPGGR